MKNNGMQWLTGGLAFVWILSGCNVLEPLGSKRTSALDYEGLLLRGNSDLDVGNEAQAAGNAAASASATALALKDTATAKADSANAAADFKNATPYFQNAIAFYDSARAKNPAGSEAYLYHAQAMVHMYGIDYATIHNQFDRPDSVTGLPFITSSSTVQSVDSIYYPVTVAVTDLEHILRGRDTLFLTGQSSDNSVVFLPPDVGPTGVDTAGDGRISPSVARMDLGILSAVKGLLAPIDMDGNGHINDSCGVNPVVAVDTVCPNGLGSEADRLKNVINATANFNLSSLDTKNLNSKALSDNPNDINNFGNLMKEPLASAAYNLDSVHSSLLLHNQDSLAKSMGTTVSRITDLNHFLEYLKYNDHVDNDYDRQNNVQSPMLWHDYDKDHGILFNADDSALFRPYVSWSQSYGYNFGYPGNIGFPIHRFVHPELYVTYGALKARYPNLVTDTTANGRIPLMQKKCNTIMDSLLYVDATFNGGRNSAAITNVQNVVCDSISTVLQSTVTPPLHSEWIGGTAGVDEEMLDGYDNDYDGLTDEDTRNQPGYDDDDDAPLRPCMMTKNCPDGATATPMVWKDLPSHKNACIDIDTTIPMPTGSSSWQQREFCVGTLENRLYLARQMGAAINNSLAKSALDTNYQSFGSQANPDCITTYNNNIDPVWLAFKGAFNATSVELNKACSYKHIWIGDPPGHGKLKNSEWTGGLFGIDEEICGDGIDNDGDGWVDEDCGSH